MRIFILNKIINSYEEIVALMKYDDQESVRCEEARIEVCKEILEELDKVSSDGCKSDE